MDQNINPQKLIDDLQYWITANREDQVWTQHESLYLEVLAQWKAVNRYRPEKRNCRRSAIVPAILDSHGSMASIIRPAE